MVVSGSELDIRAYTFKIIARHKLVDTNKAPTDNIYRVFQKLLHPVCARVLCYQHPDNNEPEELTKVKIGAFNSSVGLHHNEFTDKKIRQE